MNIVLFAPHQDDEIISSFYFLNKYADNNINIVFATNGDYRGDETAKQRYAESEHALNLCGLGTKNIHYMGYADTGMRFSHSFLYKLYFSLPDTLISSPYSKKTYHPASRQTIHKFFCDNEAIYCRKHFSEDIKLIIKAFKPSLIIMPSLFDRHGDHMALSLFLREALLTVHHYIDTLSYLIHTDNDSIWPERYSLEWSRPDILTESVWNRKISVAGDDNLICGKKFALSHFHSQFESKESYDFLFSYVKRSEFFLPY